MGIVAFTIITFVSLIMFIIGLCQYKKVDEPTGFYNVGDGYKKEDISDIKIWNKEHGKIWIAYGLIIEVGYVLSYFSNNTLLEFMFLFGSILIPLPLMVIRHQYLEKKYKK